MIIAIVANTSWNIYNFRIGIVKHLKVMGHHVVVIAPRDEYSDSLINIGVQYQDVQIDNKGNNPYKDFKFFLSLLTIYRHIKPDVILHYTIKPNIYGNFAAAISRIPSINTVSGLGTVFLREGFSSRLAKYLYKLAFRSSKKVFFQNSSDKEVFLNEGLVKTSLASVVPGSGIDLSRYQFNTYQRDERITFLFVGRLLYHKGIVEYLEAAKILIEKGYNWRFLICGAIESQSNLGIQVDELASHLQKGCIEYLGFSNEIVHIIQSATCIVLPSYREGISRTLLESAALAKPLIASDVPGCREVVVDGYNGYTCRPAEAKDLTEKMEKMGLLSNDERTVFGLNGRKLVEESYDVNLVIKQYVEAIIGLAR